MCHGLTNQGQVPCELNRQFTVRTGMNDDVSSFVLLQVIFSCNCSLPCISSGSRIWISKIAKRPGEPGCCKTVAVHKASLDSAELDPLRPGLSSQAVVASLPQAT